MSFGGFAGMMGPNVGSALVRIGADFTGLRTQARVAMAGLKQEMTVATRALGGIPVGKSPVAGLNRELDTAVKRTQMLQKAMKALFLGVGLVGVTGIGAAINAAVQYESAFAGVEKTVQATAEEIAGLRQEFLDMSMQMPVSASVLAGIGEAAGALGVAVPDIREFVEVVSTIGNTTNVSVDEAGTALGQLSNILQMTSEDYSRFASTLVSLGNSGASTEKEILEIARRFGGAAKQFGLATDEILALSSAVANLGMQPQLAGSTLSRFVSRLVAVAGAGTQVENMAKSVGLSLADFNAIVTKGGDNAKALAKALDIPDTNLKKIVKGADALGMVQRQLGMTNDEWDRMVANDPAALITNIFRGLSGMNGADRQLFMGMLMGPAATAGGGEGMSRFVNGLADSIDRNLVPSLRNAEASWKDNTAAVDEAEKRYKTTASQFAQLKNFLNVGLIQLGTTALPTVVEALNWIAERVPGVFEALSKVYRDSLEGPFTALLNSAGQLGETLGRILFDWGEGGAGQSVGGVFAIIAESVGIVARQLSVVLDGLNAMVDNPVVGGLAKIALAFGAIALSVRALGAFRGLMGGLGNSALRMLSFGRLGGTGAALDPSATMQQKAATQQMTAAEMQLRAATIESAGSLKPGLMPMGGAMGKDAALIRTGGQGIYRVPAAIQPPPGTPKGYQYVDGRWLSPAAAPIGSLSAAGFQKMDGTSVSSGRQLLERTSIGLQNGLRAGLTNIKSAAMTGLSLVSKAFWPLFIADLVGNLVAAPIGDFIRGSTGFKRLADQWSKGWIDGLAATFQTLQAGDDVFVGRPESYRIGERDVSTGVIESLARRGPNPADAVKRADELMNAVEGAESNLDLLMAVNDLGSFLQDRIRNMRFEPDMRVLDGQVATWNLHKKWAADNGRTVDIAMMPDMEALQDASLSYSNWAQNILDAALEFGYVTEEGAKDLQDTLNREVANIAIGARAAENWHPFEELRDRLKEWASGADEALRSAIIDAAGQIGLSIPGYQLAQLDPEQTRRVAGLFSGEQQLPSWLASWGVEQLGGRAYERTRYSEDGRVSTKDIQKDLAGLESWREQQKGTYGEGAFDVARNWLQKFGESIETGDSGTNVDRAKVIKKVLGRYLDLNGVTLDPENEKQIDRYWAMVYGYFNEAQAIVGMDQQAQLAEGVRSSVTKALMEGANISAADWAVISSSLWDGVGSRDADAAEGLGDIVSSWWQESVKKGIKEKDLLARFNEIFAGIEGEGFVPAGSGKELRDAVLAGYLDDFKNADTKPEKQALQDKLAELFPKRFQNWDDVKAAMTDKGVTHWADIYKAMAADAEIGQGTYSEDLGAQWGTGFNTGVEKTPEAVVPTPKTDLGAAYRLGVAAANAFNLGLASVPVIGRVLGAVTGGGGGWDGQQESQSDRDGAVGGALRSVAMAMSNPSSLVPAVPRMATAPALAQSGPSGPSESGSTNMMSSDRTQNIYVQRMNVMGPDDESSLLRQLSFMEAG